MPFLSSTEGPDLNAGLKLITQRALVLTRAAGAAIALNHQGSMICRASAGANAPSLGCRMDVSSGFSAECIRTGKALRCDDSESDPRVDVLTCRRIGVRSIVAAPILFERNVVGVLELFSPQQFAFNDEHLAVAERLAQAVLRNPPPPPKPTPPPKLLVQLEPAHRVFFRNLDELVFPPRPAPLNLTSRPGRFWPDVFVPSPMPWEGLFQSLALHVMMLAVLGSTLQFLLVDRHPLTPRRFNKSEVIYYLPNEYASLLPPHSAPRPAPKRAQAQSAMARQTPLAVARERSNPVQAAIKPPEIKLKQDLQLLHLISLNSLVPAMPISAASRTHLTTPPDLASVVAPPPDVSAATTPRSVAAPDTSVIEPPPSLTQLARQVGDISIRTMQVVAPPPQMPAREQSSIWASVKATLGSVANAIIPPAPAIKGVPTNAAGRGSSVLSGAGTPIIPPPPAVQPAGGSIRGTPDGTGFAVVPPPPSVSGSGDFGRRGASALAGASSEVVPPPPALRGARGSIRGTAADGTGFVVVPPPPSFNGTGSSGRRGAGSLADADTQVVPPPPALRGAGGSIRGTAADGTGFVVVPPPPSFNGTGRSGRRGAGSLAGDGTQVVPPPPAVRAGAGLARGLGNGNDSAVVPPPPSIRGGGFSGRGDARTVSGAGMHVVPPPPQVGAGAGSGPGSSARQGMGSLPVAAMAFPPPDVARLGSGASNGHGLASGATAPGVLPQMDPLPTDTPLPPMDPLPDPNAPPADGVELAVNLLGPTVPLPNSSYFSSQEIFLAEERVSPRQSRLIKLIYEFLPYQPKLSEYGPNFPALDKLRVTRDPGCDETLALATSINTSAWPQAGRLRLKAKYLNVQETTLACFRTTADDYRQALERRRK